MTIDAATFTPTTDVYRRKTIARFYASVRRADYAAAEELLSRDHVTEWPQSGERIDGPVGCLAVYAAYPGGHPRFDVRRILGCGTHWSAELTADYSGRRVEVVSLIEFAGSRIARHTDYFADAFDQPEWRRGVTALVDSVAHQSDGS